MAYLWKPYHTNAPNVAIEALNGRPREIASMLAPILCTPLISFRTPVVEPGDSTRGRPTGTAHFPTKKTEVDLAVTERRQSPGIAVDAR